VAEATPDRVMPVPRWSVPDPSTRVVELRPPGSPPTPARVSTRGAWLLVTGGGLAMLGSVLPWSVVTSAQGVLSADGLRGDGRITAVLGGLLLVLGAAVFAGWSNRAVGITGLVTAIAVTAVAGYNAFNLDDFGEAADQMAALNFGHGLLITAIGGLIALLGSARLVARA
jgi:hypothetical protein